MLGQDDDGDDALNPVVFEYIEGTLSKDEQDLVWD